MHSRTRCLLAFTVLTGILFPLQTFADEPKPSGAIAEKLQPFVDKHTLAGAVVGVASKDKILTIESVGFADIGAKKPMKQDSVFWIASMSKPITGAALMMLVDQGKVNVDDPVEKYLPEFKGQMLVAEKKDDQIVLRKPKHPITVRNCLTHTSGLAFASPLERPTLDMLPLKVAVGSYAMTPLLYEPDTEYRYSNAGINIAGRIIEVVSGMPYEQFLDERLFKPLEMKDTTFWPNEEQIGRLAKSYRPNKAKTDLEEFRIPQLHYPLNQMQRQPMPGGGLFSTTGDCLKFCQMVLNGGTYNGKMYLSEAAVKQMTSKQTPEAVKNGYGFGWSTSGDRFGHGGAHATDMSIDAKRGLVLVFMVQHAGYANGDEGKQILPTFQKTAFEKYSKP